MPNDDDTLRLFAFPTYGGYVAAQLRAYDAKARRVWATPAELDAVAALVRDRLPDARRGICHGVRTGAEVHALRRLLPGVDVIGTEIAEVAAPHVLGRCDFHFARAEWAGAFDFAYSNALDHAHTPHAALRAWAESLRPGGLVLLHWSPEHDSPGFPNGGADCFQASRAGYRRLIAECGLVPSGVLAMPGNLGRCVLVARNGRGSPGAG